MGRPGRRVVAMALAGIVVCSVVAAAVDVTALDGAANTTSTSAVSGADGLRPADRSDALLSSSATAGATSDPKYANNSTTEEVTVDGFGGVSTSSTSSPTIDVQYTLNRTPSTPGSVVWVYDLEPYDDGTNSLEEFTVFLEDDHEVIRADDFANQGGGEWKWDRSNTSQGNDPILYVRTTVNTSTSSLNAVDTGPWAFLDQDDYTESRYAFRYLGEAPTYRRSFSVVRNGTVSDGLGYAYLGNYTLRTRSDYVDGRLVDPAVETLPEDPQTVLRLVSDEGEQLDIGARRNTVTIFTPGTPMRRGGAAYDDEFWVRNDTRITNLFAESVYYHEYVHTRQAFSNSSGLYGENTYWLIEGSAEYYQHYVPYRFNQTSDDALRFGLNASEEYRDVTLTNVTRFTGGRPDYEKGGHVLTALDLRIRNVSGGTATLENVLREVNRRELQNGDRAVNFTVFKDVVEQEAGTSLDSWLERYVNSSDIPTLPQNLSAAYDTTGGVPVAEAGPNRTVREGETVTLEARNSTDPNLEPLSYAWTQTAGPDADIADPNTATPDVTAPRVQNDSTLTLELQADDDDGNGDADSLTVTVLNVTTENAAPTARNDTNTTREDTTLSVPAPGVLGNDTDPEGDSLTATVVSSPGNGTVSLAANGSYEYTPEANFSGTDSFEYVVNDTAGNTDTATVTITVRAVNDDPVARNDANDTDEDTTLSVPAPGVLANDTDVDGDTLAADRLVGPSNGTLRLAPNGSYEYTPEANFSGTDSFEYVVTDGEGGNDTATVTITVRAVNDPPTARDDAYATEEDTRLGVAAPGVLGNDTDVDDDSLTAALVSGPANGSLTLSTNGAFEYIPDENFAGTDSFSYETRDGNGGTDTATVSIAVEPVDDPPTAQDDAYTTDEDTALSVDAPGVLENDSDPDDTLTASLAVAPDNGTLTLDANGSFVYEPAENFAGTDSFVYNASDGSSVDSATVTITVRAVNDPPTARDDAYATEEDTRLGVAAPGVLGNDTDVDNDSLTAALVSGTANGSLTLNEMGAFEYTPEENFAGTDSFTYETRDGNGGTDTATVTITVEPVNDPPTARNDSAVTDENTTLSVPAPGVLGNDSDPDDTLTAALVSGPTNGTVTVNASGGYEYLPDPGFSGVDTFIYEARDGEGGTDTATVTVEVQAGAEPLSVAWRSVLDARVQGASPAVDAERAYAGSLGRNLTALNRSTGVPAWTFRRSGSLVDSSPVLSGDTLYVGSGGGTLYALNRTDGGVRWQFDNDSAIASTPRVAGGTVYVGSNDGDVYALNASTGELAWVTNAGGPVLSRPAVDGTNDRVYVTTRGGTLVALAAGNGTVAWARSTGGNAGGASPAVHDGDVLVATDRVYRYDRNGSRLWAESHGGSAGSSPVVADGVVYVGSADGGLYALDVGDGSRRWRADLGGAVAADPAVTGGRVIVGTTAGGVYLLNASTGGLVASVDLGAAVRSPATVIGDTAYLGTRNGTVVRLNNLSGGSAGATPSLAGSVDGTPGRSPDAALPGATTGLDVSVRASRRPS